jgi:hypothetical protein
LLWFYNIYKFAQIIWLSLIDEEMSYPKN